MREGALKDDSVPNDKVKSPIVLTIVLLVSALGIALGLAVGATFVCKFFTWITGGNQVLLGHQWSVVGILIGLPVFIAPVFYFLMRRGTIGHKFFKIIIIEEPKAET